jgi:hypothetical protein
MEILLLQTQQVQNLHLSKEEVSFIDMMEITGGQRKMFSTGFWCLTWTFHLEAPFLNVFVLQVTLELQILPILGLTDSNPYGLKILSADDKEKGPDSGSLIIWVLITMWTHSLAMVGLVLSLCTITIQMMDFYQESRRILEVDGTRP